MRGPERNTTVWGCGQSTAQTLPTQTDRELHHGLWLPGSCYIKAKRVDSGREDVTHGAMRDAGIKNAAGFSGEKMDCDS